MNHPELSYGDGEPSIADHAESRQHRKRQLALAYRLFGAFRWGSIGDGHISARDPQFVDHFWISRLGVPFSMMTVSDLVLVGPDGLVVEGDGDINPAAHHIHWPLLQSRADVVAAAHTHTPFGTSFSAYVRCLRPMTLESCWFHGDHAVFDDEEVNIRSTDGGWRIADAIGQRRAVILRNHGLLTVGSSIGEAVGLFIGMERAAEAELKSPDARPIDDASAERARRDADRRNAAWVSFQWLVRTHVPDPVVVA